MRFAGVVLVVTAVLAAAAAPIGKLPRAGTDRVGPIKVISRHGLSIGFPLRWDGIEATQAGPVSFDALRVLYQVGDTRYVEEVLSCFKANTRQAGVETTTADTG
jgi:hypothetical protein